MSLNDWKLSDLYDEILGNPLIKEQELRVVIFDEASKLYDEDTWTWENAVTMQQFDLASESRPHLEKAREDSRGAGAPYARTSSAIAALIRGKRARGNPEPELAVKRLMVSVLPAVDQLAMLVG